MGDGPPPIGFYVDKGVIKPITAPKPKHGGVIVGAAVFLVLSAVAGGTAGTAAAPGGTAPGDSGVEQSIETRTTNDKESARRGQYDETWKRLRLKPLRPTLKQIDREFQCASRSTLRCSSSLSMSLVVH